MKDLVPKLLFLSLLLLMSSIYYGDNISRLPYGTHEWAQGDRYALAINFYDNGMDFFKPATNSIRSSGGITGVEFPLQAYLAALMAKIAGRDQISACFRLLDIFITVTGLYFLFLAVYKRTRNFFFSGFAPVFFFCAPSFVFYAGNYLPDPASVSVCFMAFYYFLDYLDGQRSSRLYAALMILTLAVLVKASTVSYLAGVGLTGLYLEYKRHRDFKKILRLALVGMLSIAIIGAQMWYIKYLNDTYESFLFLAKTNPFKGIDAFNSYIEHDFKNMWMNEYLLTAQYPVFVMIVSAGIYGCFRQRKGLLLLPAIPFLAGAITMAFLFGAQLPVHDYYILPMFFPLLAYLMVVSLLVLHSVINDDYRAYANVPLLGGMIILFFFADHQVYNRQNQVGIYHDEYATSPWLMHGAAILKRLHVPQDARIVVLDEQPPNLSLVYFDRKGYVVLPDEWKGDINFPLIVMGQKGSRYLICRAELYKKQLQYEPKIAASFRVLWLDKDKAILQQKD